MNGERGALVLVYKVLGRNISPGHIYSRTSGIKSGSLIGYPTSIQVQSTDPALGTCSRHIWVVHSCRSSHEKVSCALVMTMRGKIANLLRHFSLAGACLGWIPV